MPPTTGQRVPIAALERLATYHRHLLDLEQERITTISSASLETHTGIPAAQFRKDLSYFGEFGKPGVGYEVSHLRESIARILRMDREQRVLLVGAGNLGAALVGYPGLKEQRLRLVAVFDNNYAKIGRRLWDMQILDVATLTEVNREMRAGIGIIAVPRQAAQGAADALIAAGVRAILNFAPATLRVPPGVMVRNVSFVQELAVLSYHLASLDGEDVTTPDYSNVENYEV
ncbi:MAG: redox-sensing transcriptional repressor Rex [Chthonomonadales bacterium]|nr:redox-sensing transcriptional repressor Rex [Chthonomonadales bacterium]